MKFTEMCEDLLNEKHKMAYRECYTDLLTTVRLKDNGNAGKIITFFEGALPQIPLVITKEIYASDDWVVIDNLDSRCNIANFIGMLNAKEFLKDLWNSLSTQTKDKQFTRGFTDKPGYSLRFNEALALGLIHADPKQRVLEFTETGRALVKTL